MPTRYLKPGIRDSGHIEGLSGSPDAEITYYRLLVTVDDFGRFDARPLMIKAACYPTRLRATADKCMQWLESLRDVGLIILYEVDSKPYLQITKWDNKPRAAVSKYPDPPDNVYTCPQMLPVTVTVTETVTPQKRAKKINGSSILQPKWFENFWTAFPRKVDKADAIKAWNALEPRPDFPFMQRLIYAIEQSATSEAWQRENGKFIPYPATWLRHKRWEDEGITLPENSRMGKFVI